MSRSFRVEKRYSLGVPETFAVLTDPSFLEQRARYMGSTDVTCTREEASDGVVILHLEENRDVPGKRAPLRSTLTFRWTTPTSAEWSQRQHGYEDRSSAQGSVRIYDEQGAGCKVVVSGKLEIRVPLLGRVLEGTVLSRIMQGHQKEAEFFESWVAERGLRR